MRRTSFALAFAVACLSWQAAEAAVANRLYIKQSGTIAGAIDTDGSFYTRGGYADMSEILGGFRIKVNGSTAVALNQASSSDQEQLGKYAYMHPDGRWERNTSLPESPSGSLLFKFSGSIKMEIEPPAVGTWNMTGDYVEMFQYRKNAGFANQADRQNFVDALMRLNSRRYPGQRTDTPLAGGVSYWMKEDEVHQATHNHGGPSFIPWHRELVNRFEANLRLEDPLVSLFYWEWFYDPRWDNVVASEFGPGFMGAANGAIGEPFLSKGFYRPTCTASAQCKRSDSPGGTEQFWNTGNPYDPPQFITRQIRAGDQFMPWPSDIVHAGDGLSPNMQWQAFRQALEDAHNQAHGNVGGSIGQIHSAFEDPFVYLLHANVDRYFASWQRLGGTASFCPGQANWRLAPSCVYGNESTSTGTTGITTPMEPWANSAAGTIQVRPWAAPESDRTFPSCTQGFPCPGQIVRKDSKHATVVQPPLYDTYID
jgi:hypothetical protein